MGLYLRKAFRTGPVRFNLSKSGIGLSGGIKGTRVGVGPRGTYVHAGRHGLYYRKYVSSGRRARAQSTADGEASGGRWARAQSTADGNGCITLLLIAIAIGLCIWLFRWVLENPVFLITGIAVAIGIPTIRYIIRLRWKQAVAAYRQSLDSALVAAQSPPSAAVLADLKQQQKALPKTRASAYTVEKIESEVYQAVIDKILDDGFITKDEAATIAAAEQVLSISPAIQLRMKKEIFSAAYVNAIQDRQITQEELDKLSNLMAGLAIPQMEVQHELDIIREIIDTQTLCLPFEPIPPDQLAVPTQRSEDAFYQCSAQVFSKRKSKDAPTGYEYSVQREGTMILTNKRVFVAGDRTTNIRFSDIEDVYVDIDEGVIEISKVGSARPIVLKTNTPIYIGRAIDLLVNAEAGARGNAV